MESNEHNLRQQQKRFHEEAMKAQKEHFRQMRLDDRNRASAARPSPDGRSDGHLGPTVWIFGAIGAFVMLALSPQGWRMSSSALVGFLVGGFLGGVLMKWRIGRVILLVVGLAFAALVVIGIATH